MFGIGMQELMIIFVVALLVLGPAKLPGVARSVGKGLRELRKASDELRTSIMFEEDEDTHRRAPRPPRAIDESPVIQGSLATQTQGPAEADEVALQPASDVVARGAASGSADAETHETHETYAGDETHEGPLPDDPEVKQLIDDAKQKSAAAASAAAAGPAAGEDVAS